jgi:hypothetical protein
MTDPTDLANATHAGSPDRLPNGGMQQTRSALTTIGAALAADPGCSADLLRPESPTDRLGGSKTEGSPGTALLDGLDDVIDGARPAASTAFTLLGHTDGRRQDEWLPDSVISSRSTWAASCRSLYTRSEPGLRLTLTAGRSAAESAKLG